MATQRLHEPGNRRNRHEGTIRARVALGIVVMLTIAGGGASAALAGTASTALGVPIYKPSTLVHKTKTTQQRRTRSRVVKVSAFYAKALRRKGWHIIHATRLAYSANFMAKRRAKGATIQISSTGKGSSISIVTYRR
jgi:hypothetical protein